MAVCAGYLLFFGLTVYAFYALGLPRIAFGGVTALLALLVGLEGHEWTRRRYARKGWTHAGTVSGRRWMSANAGSSRIGWRARVRAGPPADAPLAAALGPAAGGVLGVFPEARYQGPGRA